MSAEAWEDPLRTTRKHLDQLSADKGENDESIARLEDEKDLVLRALGGALARKSARKRARQRSRSRPCARAIKCGGPSAAAGRSR